MPYPYDPAAWRNFYVMMGSGNAALTRLVFVALGRTMANCWALLTALEQGFRCRSAPTGRPVRRRLDR